MKRFLVLSCSVAISALFFHACSSSDDSMIDAPLTRADAVSEKIVFQDDFNQADSIPDRNKWSLCKKGSPAWSKYLSESYDQAYVHDGKLVLVAEKVNGVYKTGGVQSLGKAEFQYGKIEICARFTKTAKGGWPAIWMMPAKPVYSGWPACGEIDIMENVGYDPDTIVGSSHTEKYNHAIGTQKNAKIACPDCYKAFHVYALEWEEDEYRLYVDDQLYFTFKNEGTGYEVWPYDKRFHILLNLAIGGNWGGQKGIDDSLFPHVFEIDYVRVYKK